MSAQGYLRTKPLKMNKVSSKHTGKQLQPTYLTLATGVRGEVEIKAEPDLGHGEHREQ